MDLILDTVFISLASGLAYSEPIAMGQNNALAVGVTTINGGTAATTCSVEGSNDKANWGTTGITPGTFAPAFAAAPLYNSAVATMALRLPHVPGHPRSSPSFSPGESLL